MAATDPTTDSLTAVLNNGASITVRKLSGHARVVLVGAHWWRRGSRSWRSGRGPAAADDQTVGDSENDLGHGLLTSSSLPRTVGRIPPRDPSGREITETAQRRIYFQHISEKHDPGIGVTVRNAIMPVELPSPIVFIVANVVNPISFVYNPAAGKNNDIRVVGERPVHSLFSRNCVGFFEVVFAETNFSVGEGVRTTF